MILDISDAAFKRIMDDQRLFLPIRWDGVNFATTLENHFRHYLKCIEKNVDILKSGKKGSDFEFIIQSVCGLLVSSVKAYLKGFPDEAYRYFCRVMDEFLERHKLKIYENSVNELLDGSYEYSNRLNLYRVVRVPDNRPYPRSRVFHTPYNMRSRVSSCRYSIAGYPSLYLATSIRLCCEELHFDPYQDLAIASLFKLERNLDYANVDINVIELAIKPQDFLQNEARVNNDNNHRHFSRRVLDSLSVKAAYMLWYPLIAACSFIRTDKSAPFAAEYIVPQLLMQWVRRVDSESNRKERLTGIRYFSCASDKASDMGFNYVFPTSGEVISDKLPFCEVLSRAFRLTTPVYLSEYSEPYYSDCEYYLERKEQSGDLNYIDAT